MPKIFNKESKNLLFRSSKKDFPPKTIQKTLSKRVIKKINLKDKRYKAYNMEERVILVDSQDKEIGVGEKIETHRQGKLHRAFSIFVFNPRKEMLIQQIA